MIKGSLSVRNSAPVVPARGVPVPVLAGRVAFDLPAVTYRRVVPPIVGLWRSWERAPACRGGHRSDPDLDPPTTRMPSVYILQSESTNRFYVGCTAQVALRLIEHQRGQTRSTRGCGPWRLVYEELYPTLTEARKRELQVKSWKSHRSIQRLIDSSHKMLG